LTTNWKTKDSTLHDSKLSLASICTYFLHKWNFNLLGLLFLRERDHWGDPDADGRIILRGILRKWEGIVGTGWSGLRIGTGGGLL
jgi:hypothetical protein